MNSKSISFTGSQGVELDARLDMPESGELKFTVLFAHCFTCSKNLRAVGHISKALTGAEAAVFRFDFTGLGQSEGDFGDTNFSSNVDDLGERHMDRVIENLDKALLIFHSPVDQTVGVENAAHIFKHARHPKSFISLDQADHLLLREADARYVGAVAAAWAGRYLM